MTTPQRTRYERLPKYPGVQRVHSRTCAYLAGKRCSCQPGYLAEAFDKVTGKRERKTLPTREAASRWRDDLRSSLRSGTSRLVDKVTVAQAWNQWHADALAGVVRKRGGGVYKPSVLREYESAFRRHLLPRFGRVPVSELRTAQLQGLVEQLQRDGKAPSTIGNTIIPLHVLLGWAIGKEMLTVNPCHGVRLPHGEKARDHIVRASGALELIGALATNGVSDDDIAVWATAFFSGLRRGELLALDWSAVDLDERVVRVERALDPGVKREDVTACASKAILGFPAAGSGAYVAPKSAQGKRSVGIPNLLVPYLARLQRTEGLVFGPDGLRPFSDRVLYDRAYKVWDAAGQERISLHSCRHTYASLMIDAGVDISKISKYMGHAQVAITIDRYGHLLPDDLARTLAVFDRYLDREAVAHNHEGADR